MSDKVELKRKGTMEHTAQEGIQYLKENKKDVLLAIQGLGQTDEEPLVKIQKMNTVENCEDADESSLNSDVMKRTKTMDETLAEAGDFIKDFNPLEPRSLKKKSENYEEDSPKLNRTNTIQETKKSAHHFLGTGDRGERRSQTKKTAQNYGNKETPKSDKKTKDGGGSEATMKRTGTMVDTAATAEYFLGSESYGMTRSTTKSMKGSEQDTEAPSMKKTRTIADTTAMAGYFIGGKVYGETRSATKMAEESDDSDTEAPSMKKTKTITDTTAAAGTFLKEKHFLESRSQSKALKDSEKTN